MKSAPSPVLETSLPTPPASRVWLTLAVTLLAAAAVLVVVVLPAEYQLDPTGLGGLLGLDRLRGGADTDDPLYLPPAQEGAATEQTEPYRTETVKVAIGAREEVEHKMMLSSGGTVVFSWRTDRGTLYSDFHAEPFNDLDASAVRYSEHADVAAGHGSLHAPFAGYHGWYWRNENDFPVEITLEVTGYFTGFKELYRAPVTTGTTG